MAVIVSAASSPIDRALSAPSSSPVVGPSLDLKACIPHPIDLGVVAAVVAAPATVPEYRLVNSTKRKSDTDDLDDGPDRLPYGHVAKRPKQDDPPQPHSQSLEYLEPTPTQEQRFNVTVEEALAAILSLPPFQAQIQQPPRAPAPYPLPPTDLLPALPGVTPSILPAPAPAHDHLPHPEPPYLLDPDTVPLDSDDDKLEDQYPIPFRKSPPRENRFRPRALTLWKLACKTRVEHIINVYSYQAIRESIRKQYGGPSSPQAEEWQSDIMLDTTQNLATTQPYSPIPSPLELEICTPLDFDQHTKPVSMHGPPTTADDASTSATTDTDGGDSETDSDLDFEDVDMDMDLDAEGEDDDDEVTSPHELLLSFPSPPSTVPSMSSFSSPFAYNADSFAAPNPLHPIDPALAHLPLPSISSIPAYCLRGYGGVESESRGTPARVLAEARGTLRELRLGVRA